jgi:hypothetical protein
MPPYIKGILKERLDLNIGLCGFTEKSIEWNKVIGE